MMNDPIPPNSRREHHDPIPPNGHRDYQAQPQPVVLNVAAPQMNDPIPPNGRRDYRAQPQPVVLNVAAPRGRHDPAPGNGAGLRWIVLAVGVVIAFLIMNFPGANMFQVSDGRSYATQAVLQQVVPLANPTQSVQQPAVQPSPVRPQAVVSSVNPTQSRPSPTRSPSTNTGGLDNPGCPNKNGLPIELKGGVNANQRINVRSGPGTNYDRVDSIAPRINVCLRGRNQEGTWLMLSWNRWVSASLITLHSHDVWTLPVTN